MGQRQIPDYDVCRQCGGSGFVLSKEHDGYCPACKGKGIVKQAKKTFNSTVKSK